jgi:hypothetical protein
MKELFTKLEEARAEVSFRFSSRDGQEESLSCETADCHDGK